MRIAFQILSWIALAGVIMPCFAFLLGKVTLESVKSIMLGATILWFVSSIVRMKSRC